MAARLCPHQVGARVSSLENPVLLSAMTSIAFRCSILLYIPPSLGGFATLSIETFNLSGKILVAEWKILDRDQGEYSCPQTNIEPQLSKSNIY
jgi:hypothetical protein